MPRRIPVTRWIVGAALALPAGLPAQAVPLDRLPVGTHLRITAECTPVARRPGRAPSPNRRDGTERCRRYRGTLERVTPDTLVLRSDGRETALARSAIRSAQARLGTRGSADVGLALGGAVGLAWGISAAVRTDCPAGDPYAGLCDATLVAQMAGGAIIGAGAGALIGALVRRDHWVPVALRGAGPLSPPRPPGTGSWRSAPPGPPL